MVALVKRVLAPLRLLQASDPAVYGRAALINTQRIYYAALVCIVVNLIHIAYFQFAVTVASDDQALWRSFIILSHALLAGGMAGLAILSYRLRSASQARLAHWLLQSSMIILILAAGVGITAADQLVSPAITPFLIACVLVSILFIQHPLVSLIAYLFALCILWFMLGVFQQDYAVLVSNRLNAISVIGMSLCLSAFAWCVFNKEMSQLAFIELQQAELGRTNAALAALAATDPLTGLLNRRSFKGMLERELSRVRQTGQGGSLIIVDLDHFKRINDEHGHPVGDRVLQSVANILRQNVRKTDLLVRWGGEEFLVLLPECTLEKAVETAEMLRLRIAELTLANGDAAISVTASFGVAALDPAQADAFVRSYQGADQALYEAKIAGRNQTMAARLDAALV